MITNLIFLASRHPDLDGKKASIYDQELAALRKLLVSLEWSGIIWTDTQVCPSCGAAKEGHPAYVDWGKITYPEQIPKTHTKDCKLALILNDLGYGVLTEA